MTGALLALLAAAAVPQPGAIRTFGDWTVGCDNGLDCQAVALVPDGATADDIATATIMRGSAAADRPQVAIELWNVAATAMLIDGKRFALTGGGQEEYRPADPAAFVAALIPAQTAVFVDARGKIVGTLSSSGIAAALLYIDDRQRRIGTASALVRKGTKPGPPTPSAIPVIDAAPITNATAIAPTAKEVAAMRKVADCPADDFGPVSAETHALDARRTLVLLSCGAGAYNFSSVPFVIERVRGQLKADYARFDRMPSWGEDDGNPMLVNAGYEKGVLSHYAKGRGLGDCGTSQEFVWDGARFRLTEQREMHECRGSVDWIRTWRAAVKR
ncbi:DUF1176 domain-containing protein [Allosphingosinicella indica]|uniref:DUF1176 domain-containing protein n=1 Tax=Allosphingosinicella indica TaxID=941907 RepID=A0A1X7G5Q5_9SPHN|nr:DUF1176 domain-containing protein [Allosphingosinicella indica]SMF64453.1 Protein of unknown function [Allosphingosinicella indica]